MIIIWITAIQHLIIDPHSLTDNEWALRMTDSTLLFQYYFTKDSIPRPWQIHIMNEISTVLRQVSCCNKSKERLVDSFLHCAMENCLITITKGLRPVSHWASMLHLAKRNFLEYDEAQEMIITTPLAIIQLTCLWVFTKKVSSRTGLYWNKSFGSSQQNALTLLPRVKHSN